MYNISKIKKFEKIVDKTFGVVTIVHYQKKKRKMLNFFDVFSLAAIYISKEEDNKWNKYD